MPLGRPTSRTFTIGPPEERESRAGSYEGPGVRLFELAMTKILRDFMPQVVEPARGSHKLARHVLDNVSVARRSPAALTRDSARRGKLAGPLAESVAQ
jgi:hypothetical protein